MASAQPIAFRLDRELLALLRARAERESEEAGRRVSQAEIMDRALRRELGHRGEMRRPGRPRKVEGPVRRVAEPRFEGPQFERRVNELARTLPRSTARRMARLERLEGV